MDPGCRPLPPLAVTAAKRRRTAAMRFWAEKPVAARLGWRSQWRW
uniref:Uncharacterized protein n=1 Tax=Arundo donax TaxID=35708 RepID=A0A0A8ZTC3_ARUDO